MLYYEWRYLPAASIGAFVGVLLFIIGHSLFPTPHDAILRALTVWIGSGAAAGCLVVGGRNLLARWANAQHDERRQIRIADSVNRRA